MGRSLVTNTRNPTQPTWSTGETADYTLENTRGSNIQVYELQPDRDLALSIGRLMALTSAPSRS